MIGLVPDNGIGSPEIMEAKKNSLEKKGSSRCEWTIFLPREMVAQELRFHHFRVKP